MENRTHCIAPRANSQCLQSASGCSELAPSHPHLARSLPLLAPSHPKVARRHPSSLCTAWEAPPRTASFLPAHPSELVCTQWRFPMLQDHFTTHRSGSACNVAILRHTHDRPCVCEMLSSHATRKHVRFDVVRARAKPLRWKREFASSRGEVLHRRRKSLRRATSSLRVTATLFRRTLKLFAARLAHFHAQRIRSGTRWACTGQLHPRSESSGSAWETLSVRTRRSEELPRAAS
jgi:hypothetical protein